MKKMLTIFKRNPDNMREILTEQHPDCLWVFKGEGVTTRKYDGTCVKFENGKMFKRYCLKGNRKAPEGYEQVDFDPNTGKGFGWIPVIDTPENKYHLEVLKQGGFADGTYELLGPKIQGNPENWSIYEVINHDHAERYLDVPLKFEYLKNWLETKDIEGLVFQHPDGRMAKIKKSDFGLKR